MPKTLLAAAAALALSAGSAGALAESTVSIYGLVDASVEYLKFSHDGVHPQTHLLTETSDTSRLGFRGTEELGGGAKAYYKIEAGFQLDTGAQTSPSSIFNRETYVGLGNSNTFGTLQLGSQFTPALWMSIKTDPYYRFGLGGQYTLLQGVRGYQFRYDNSVQYVSPVVGGVSGRLLWAAGEGAVTGNSYSGNLEYANDKLYAGLVYDQVRAVATTVGRTGDPVFSKTLSLGTRYDLSVVKLFGWYQTNHVARVSDVDGYMVGASLPFGLSEVRASFSHRTGPNSSASLGSIGYVTFLSKNTELYTTVGRLTNSHAAAFRMGPATGEQTAAGLPFAGQNTDGMQLGMRHWF